MISVEELAELAGTHRLVPLHRVLFADGETPVGVYRKLAAGRPGTFLFESAEPGRSFSRWSFIGVAAQAQLVAAGDRARWIGPVPAGDPDLRIAVAVGFERQLAAISREPPGHVDAGRVAERRDRGEHSRLGRRLEIDQSKTDVRLPVPERYPVLSAADTGGVSDA